MKTGMKKPSYSQILDAVAGDHLSNQHDLAPNILARIQKRKGFRMQPRMKVFSAALLIVFLFAVLFFTVPGVAAAFQRWFGYVPGVGLVREGQIRVLAEPVSVTRDGVTVTVDQVVLNQERTTLIYSVDGIPSAAVHAQPETPICPYSVKLLLSDESPGGSTLLASPNGIQGWAAGYQHRFDYPALPAEVNDAKLVISCLFNTQPGAAPENWEIALHFVPAPPDMTAFPVIEIPTATVAPTTPAATVTSAATTEAGQSTAPTATASAAPLTMTLDRAVQMDDGYLLYATLHWNDTPFTFADVTDTNETLHLLDGSGQKMAYEVVYDENTRPDFDQRQTVFAIKTAPVQTPGPLTLVLDSVSVDLPVEASFTFDPGPNPQPGQEWQLDQEVTIGEHRLRVLSVIASPNGYEFTMNSDSGITGASLGDLEHTIVSGGGVNSVPGGTFSSGFNYADGLPNGPINVTVGSISVRHAKPLQVQWTPPAVSTTVLPTQPAACLTASAWKSALAQPPALPEGVSGKVLTYGPSDPQNTNAEWQVALTNLDGSVHEVIAGASDGAFSPDGTKLAYSLINGGISIKDLATGATSPIPGTANGDFNPFWSPDGQQIVFNRGMGVFDLFIVGLDGSGLRPLTQGGVQEWTVGWLDHGSLLYSVPGREDEYTIYRIDVQSGASEQFATGDITSVSPDGRQLITMEPAFGDRWNVYLSEQDGSNRWLLADSDLWFLTPQWSADGQWLLAGVSDTDAGSTIGALVNPRTCQVIPLPHLRGSILSWAQ